MGDLTYLKELYLQISDFPDKKEFTRLKKYLSCYQIGMKPIFSSSFDLPTDIREEIVEKMLNKLLEKNDIVHLKNGHIQRSYIRHHVFEFPKKRVANTSSNLLIPEEGFKIYDNSLDNFIQLRDSIHEEYDLYGINYNELTDIIGEIKDPVVLVSKKEMNESKTERLYIDWSRKQKEMNDLRGIIIINYQRFIKKIIRSKKFRRDSLDDDLLQEGYIALLRALETYDPSKASFPHYAMSWISAKIDVFMNKNQSVRRSKNIEDQWRKVHLASVELNSDDAYLIAEKTKIPISIVKKRLADTPILINSIDSLPDCFQPSYDPMITLEDIDANRKERDINKILNSLSIKEQDIFRKRYSQNMTLQQIGNEYNVTRERIRQILVRSHKKLEQFIEEKRFSIDDYLN